MLKTVSYAVCKIVGGVYFKLLVSSWMRIGFLAVNNGIPESRVGVIWDSSQPENLPSSQVRENLQRF